jgi:hypothetical protein
MESQSIVDRLFLVAAVPLAIAIIAGAVIVGEELFDSFDGVARVMLQFLLAPLIGVALVILHVGVRRRYTGIVLAGVSLVSMVALLTQMGETMNAAIGAIWCVVAIIGGSLAVGSHRKKADV